MDDQNQTPFPRQPQPDEQPPVTPSQDNPEPQPQSFERPQPQAQPAPEPLVPEEYEPATERSQYVASNPEAASTSGQSPLTPVDMQTASEQPVPQFEFTPPVKKKSRKGLIIGIVAAVVAVLLIGGGAAAYKLWYQNPEKVVSDAVINAFKAKSLQYTGKFNVSYDGGKVAIDFDGANASLATGQLNLKATITADGKTFKANASGLVDNDGVLYVKLSNLREIADNLMQQYDMKTSAFDAFIAKIDDKWIKISADDLNSVSEDASKTQKCVTDTLNKFNDDDAAKQQLVDIYKKHQFLNISDNLGSQSIDGTDSIGYTITGDKTKAKAFSDEVKNTQIVKDLQKCDKSISFDDSTSADASGDDTTVKVWVSRWTHQLTRVDLQDKSSDTTAGFVFDPVFNKPVTINTPKDALTIKQLQDEFQKALTAYEQEFSSSSLYAGYSADTVPANVRTVQKQVETYNAVVGVYPTLTQLKSGTVAEAKLPSDVNALVGSTMPSSSNSALIAYKDCNQAGGVIYYYDASTGSVATINVGVCSSGV